MSKQKMFYYLPIDRVPICPDVVYRGGGWEGAGKFFGTGRDGGNAEENKRKLLEMARNGEDRPHCKTKLGSALRNYTDPQGDCYDKEFDKEIRKLRPDWFEKSSEVNKEKLLEMARNGEDRPTQRNDELGSALCSYTNPKNDCYDKEFDKEIRKLRPDWFENSAKINKEILLKMARNGEDRPCRGKHKLGRVFCHYTDPNSETYDPKFTKEIYSIAPNWEPKRSKR